MFKKINFLFLIILASALPNGFALGESDTFGGLNYQLNLEADGSAKVMLSAPASYIDTTKDGAIVSLGNKKPLNLTATQDGQELSRGQYSVYRKQGFYYLRLQEQALTTLSIDYTIQHLLVIDGANEVLRWSPLRANRLINGVAVDIALPKKIDITQVGANIFSSQAITTTSARSSEDEVALRAHYIPAKADLAVVLRWPKGMLDVNIISQWVFAQGTLKLILWLIIGIMLPLFAILYMLYRVRQSRTVRISQQSASMIAYPPNYLIPAQVGILFSKKIYPKELVATIIDLAVKGYLIIGYREGTTYLTLRKLPDQRLSTWERNLLSELFVQGDRQTTEKEIDAQTANKLSSPSVVKLFEEIYSDVTSHGFFGENPHYLRIRYKMYGLIFYFISIVMMLWILLTGLSYFFIIPISGLLVAAIVIIKLTPKISSHTALGAQEIEKWQQFKNWLTSPEPLSINQSAEGLFFTYLPHAIIFECLPQWLYRFRNQAIAIPDWYSTSNAQAEDFSREVIPIIRTISTRLSSLHGPAVN